MHKADAIRMRHMQDASREICAFVHNRNRTDLDNDRLLSLALLKLIEIIGEAAAGVSQETRNRYAEIPWADIVGMRNHLVHVYFDMDLDLVWQTATRDIPDLMAWLETIPDTLEA